MVLYGAELGFALRYLWAQILYFQSLCLPPPLFKGLLSSPPEGSPEGEHHLKLHE